MKRTRPDLAARNKRSAVHGQASARTPAYISWSSMRQRILSRSSKDFANWGGRGLDIDPRWQDFATFLADMGDRPERTSLGRIDNACGYWPHNCRWESATQQAANKRTLMNVRYQEKAWRLVDLARRMGLKPRTLSYRLSSGWPLEQAISVEATHRNRHHKAKLDAINATVRKLMELP